MALVELTDRGLYVPAADVTIDPWRPVTRALVTHGHADHARPVADATLAAYGNEHILHKRLSGRPFMTLQYGEPITIGDARISFHPAGHILGSAQIRIEVRGQVCVVSGDYKLASDPSCTPFEPVRCHSFVTESTFGLPHFRWAPSSSIIDDIVQWWQHNQQQSRPSVLLVYALGKAQRILRELLLRGVSGEDAQHPIVVHGAVHALNQAYEASGVKLPRTHLVSELASGHGNALTSRSLVLTTNSVLGTSWMKRFPHASVAVASGWMQVRGVRRRQNHDRGFVMSDHADWPSLLQAIEATGAPEVLVTHGSTAPLIRYLREHRSVDAKPLHTPWTGEGDGNINDDNEVDTEPPSPQHTQAAS
jgi:putative mRNA 3-end processing factor